MPAVQNPWRRRLRRLFFFLGTASTIYLISSYTFDRLREARIKASRERRGRELLKSHFTSLLSTISVTVYALLPTLSPHLLEAYPVEATSQALQGLSMSSLASSQASFAPPHANSLLLQSESSVPEGIDASTDSLTRSSDPGSPTAVQAPESTVGQSWSSEFSGRQIPSERGDPQDPTRFGTETDDAMSSAASASISLPPTDTSSLSNSPASDLSHTSHLHPSPPRSSDQLHASRPDLSGKSKKELWKDLKIQTLTRTLTTVYLVPLLYLLTSSQLSILARTRYMHNVKSSLPPEPPGSASQFERVMLPAQTTAAGLISGTDRTADRSQSQSTKTSWLGAFSTRSMGLSEFVDSATPSIISLPNPLSLLPTFISSRLPSIPFVGGKSASDQPPDQKRQVQEDPMEVEAQRAEAERIFLTYAWWILNEGWKGIADRVERDVEAVFGQMALKRDLSPDDWDSYIREVRAGVETSDVDGEDPAVLYSFIPHIIPPTPLPPTRTPCSLPRDPSSQHPHLLSLLSETRSHLSSPDFRFLLDKAVSSLVLSLVQTLRAELYSSAPPVAHAAASIPVEGGTKRLVDCLPVADRWTKGVWEGVPDSGVESMLAIPEFEGFAALVFGDWAPRG